MDAVWKFIKDRLNENSTKRALTLLVGFVGWKIAPEHINQIVEVTFALLVSFGLLPDKKKTAGELLLEKKANDEAELAAAEAKVAELKASSPK